MSYDRSKIKNVVLRKPAHTLRQKAIRRQFIVAGTFLSGAVLYVGMLLGCLGHTYIPYFWYVATGIFVGFAIWARRWGKRQQIELDKLESGLEGEVFVGEFLNEARAENGWYVLHDYDIGHGNIDHIVIAPQGVFTIETKNRRPLEDETTIFYDAENVRTEKRDMDSPLLQAKREAAFLAEHLQTKLTMDLFVQPIVTYPKWKLKLVGGKKLAECSVWICLTTAIPKILGVRPVKLSPDEQKRIYNFLASENAE